MPRLALGPEAPQEGRVFARAVVAGRHLRVLLFGE